MNQFNFYNPTKIIFGRDRFNELNHLVTKEDTKMSFDPKPVSLEEYNQSLRDTVNAYYEHAMNEPSMSKEEAIKSTAETSEKYLDAVQEFQEAQDMQTDNNTLDTADVQGNGVASVDAGVPEDGVSDDGVDNDGDGVDGGMDI